MTDDANRIGKERRKELALMFYDFMLSSIESVEPGVLDPYIAKLKTLNKAEIGFFAGMIAGIFNNTLQKPTKEQRDKTRKDLLESLDKIDAAPVKW